MIFVSPAIFGQTGSAKKAPPLLLQKLLKPVVLFSAYKAAPTVTHILSPDFYTRQLGFFCTQEIKFEKITKIPFKFRLGSVEDCDRMEGKRKRD